MSDVQLTDGSPVPADRSHTEIDPKTGMQKGYIVLSPEERAKGFVKPVRRSYTHAKCGVTTTMGLGLAETYARDPYFYSGTFCCGCGTHFPLSEFSWDPDGEPMDPSVQEEWNAGRAAAETREKQEARTRRIEKLRGELAALEAEVGGQEPQVEPISRAVEFTDDFLREFWLERGGRFHGPNVETGTMPESKLLPLLGELLSRSAAPAKTL